MERIILQILEGAAEDVFARCLRGEVTRGQVLAAHRFQVALRRWLAA